MEEEKQEYGLIWTGYNLPTSMEIFVGDVTSNGQNEVVAIHPTGSVYIFRYDGRIFRRIAAVNLGRRILSGAIGDIDGDGQREIVVTSGNVFVVYKWRGSRLDRMLISPTMDSEITNLAVGDLTGDFVDDVAVVVGRTRIVVFQNVGGTLVELAERTSMMPVQIKIGNAVGLPRNQIIALESVSTAGGDVVRVFSLREGSLEEVNQLNIAVKADRLIAVKNVDDTFTDEIFISTSNRRRLLIIEFLGQSLVRKWLSAGFSAPIEAVESADWDKDGRNELFVAAGSQVFIYKLRGRDFILAKRIDVSAIVFSLAAGDVDRDGFIEVIAATSAGLIIILKDFFEAKSQFLVQETVFIPKKLPPAIKVAEVKVTKIIITRKEVIPGKIIVSGKFLVSILYVAEPDRRVFAFDAVIPFTHFVPVPGVLYSSRVAVDIIVEFVDFRFNPARPREIEVIIVAQVIVFDLVIKKTQTLESVATEYGVSAAELAKINKLAVDYTLQAGDKLMLPAKEGQKA
ncbi:MAG: FG-GAP-like repeat-containing protein [Bacillota bacterium]